MARSYEELRNISFNVEQGLQDIEIEEWKRMEEMDANGNGLLVTSEQCRSNDGVPSLD